MVCGGELLRPHATVTCPETGEQFELARCPRCDTVETVPRLTLSELSGYYETGYYGVEPRRFRYGLDSFWRWCQKQRVRRLQKHESEGRILDIGCGNGGFLASLDSSSWKRTGTELSDRAASGARARGLEVLAGDITQLPLTAGSFDAVTMFHVLEHVPDAAGVLARIRDLLRDDGLLVVGVPNMASLQARIARGSWYHLDVPRHCHHFTAQSLESTLAATGFRVVGVSHFSPEYNVSGCLQSLYNLLGFPRNFIYGESRRQSAKAKSAPVTKGRRLLLLAAGAVLAPLVGSAAAVITIVEIALRRGGTIEVYARRT